jgi:hypothetical protein
MVLAFGNKANNGEMRSNPIINKKTALYLNDFLDPLK